MKFNPLVDDTAEKFEVARAVIFADLTRQAQLKVSQLRTEYNDYFNRLFIKGREFTLRRLDWRDLINGNYFKESLIGIFGYPWYVLIEIAIIWTVFNVLQCLFGLFRSAFNTYNLKSLLGPILCWLKLKPPDLLEYFCKQYSMCYNPIPHNINHHRLKNDVDIQLRVALHTLNMNWIYYTKSLKTSIRNSLLLYTIIQINDTLPLYQLPFINAMKHQLNLARNQIFNLYTYTLFNLISVKAHVEFIFHETLLKNILTIRKLQKNSFYLPSTRLQHSFCFSNSTAVPTHQEGGSPIPPPKCRPYGIRPHYAGGWWHSALTPHSSGTGTQYPSQFAKCKHQPSSRWRNPPHSHSLWTRPIMRVWTHCLHPPTLPRAQVNFTCISTVTRAHPQFL